MPFIEQCIAIHADYVSLRLLLGSVKGKTALQQRKTNYQDNTSWSPLESAADKYMIILMVTLHPRPGNHPQLQFPLKTLKEGIVTSL